ncbi:gliding motility-associated C-terminal domain-containing protein [Flavobacterium sp.]|uniref:Ig-like domain-containing protein n=1 Tax=Flavobacterium sp. TaxID=239 RepID=UPI002B4AE188|nr:gliding motility-associated C-terminal domain-containing protein [Flavobacterium sp.]HLP65102.1 gliding motility-associated C-terminal domain-containing protein [Flavobacterium sp.]
MEFTTIFKRSEVKSMVLVFLTLFLHPKITAQSIPIDATVISSQSNVDFSSNAVDGNSSTKAEVRASSGIAIGIGAYSGFIELQFPSTLPANTTSFVKIDTDDNLLPALLGGSLGGLLSSTLGTVLIGNQEFTVQAKNNATVVLQGNSQIPNEFATNRLRIVVNSQNEYFIALTPSQDYNRIRLTNRVGSLVGLNNTKRLGVYGAFYIGTPDPCGAASYTSFDGSGLNLDLLGLGGAGVANPHYVIDNTPTNFSRLSLGILALAASIEQTVYFDGLSQPSDQFLIRMKIDPSLLALGVANNIQIIGSNGPTVVQTVNLNSLLNLDLLTLLQGNQIAVIPFSPSSPVNRITIRYNSLLNVQLTQSLDLYDIKRVPPQPTITDAFTLNPVICSGSTATLIAESVSGTVLNWYNQPSGGTPIATTNSGAPFVTGILTSDTTFYVAAMRNTCSEESNRVRVDVAVVDLPTASDISIASNIDACNGFVVLSPSSSIGGAVFRYYKDQQKTQEITTGYSGDSGVTYSLNNANGQLTISGLAAINSPFSYFISLTVDGLCENAPNTLKEVVVSYSNGLTLNVSPTIQGCGSVNLVDAILNFDASTDIQYLFFDSSNAPITAEMAANITSSGTYSIQSTSLLGGCSSLVQQVIVTVNPEPSLTIPATSIVVNLGSSVTLNAVSDGTLVWYDSNGNALPSNTFGTFTTPGFFTFTVVTSIGSCTKSGSIVVAVIDGTNCPPLTERVYAETQSWGSILTGGVVNSSDAIDQNPQTYSTISTGIGLLGIGTTWQTLQWNTTIAAGTPVTVKLGSQYSGLVVAGAYSVIGTKRNGSGVPIDIGFIQPVSGSLVDLLPGENSFEFSFVPSDSSGPKEYDGIRVIVGSIASVSQNVKVYEAYYDRTVTQIPCGPNDVEDVFSGAIDLGVGVATSTVGVDNPFNAVDASTLSYATLYSGAGILAAADLTVSFVSPTLQGDEIDIMLSRPSTILDLSLLSGFTVQMYMGNTPVGTVLDNTSTLLSLMLLNGGAEAMLTIEPQPMLYDRIKIRFGGVAGVLDQLRIHDINRRANTQVIGADPTNTVEICAGEMIQLEIAPQDCVTFIWYDAPTGGNIVSTGYSYTVPNTLTPGTYDYYIQPVRFGCETFDRGKVTVVIGNTAPNNAITQIQINGDSNTTICSATGEVTLSAQLNSTLTVTNPIYYWYSFDGSNQVLIPNETTSTLQISSLAPGTYTYFVGISSDEYCPTAEADRAQVTFTILPFSQPTDITADDTAFCLGTNALITPTSTLQNPQFFWFFTNDNSQPITNGVTVGSATFTIDANGVLTVTGLTSTSSPYTYYVGLTSDTTCLNQSGNFKPVVITVNSGTTPTTTSTIQTFCQVANPTVANIQVNEPNVTWYNAPTGGTAYASTDLLVNGTIYYGSIVDGSGCESAVRLEVTVNINNGTTPTTTSTTQTFCQITNPTVTNIQVNEPNVTWYNAPTGGTAYSSTDALINGTIYYGSIMDGSGCESSIRLEVTINLSNGTTPTTTSTTQTFCQITNPTVANIQVNEPNVIWYNAPTGGTAYSSTEALINGTIYYGSIVDGSGCESSVRLEVTVNINSGTTPTTTSTTQTFCQVSNPTVANIQVNEPNVTWYNAPTGGTAYASTEALINGTIYYGSIVDGSGCESSVRLEVTVNINSGTTPTTTSTTQSFCQVLNPTVANIQVNEPNVIWYNAPTGGTAYASNDALIDGTIYYGSIVDGSGCESAVRLEVTVNINSGTTPTTTSTIQTFCQITNPTVTNIQVNEPNVIWYNAPTGGIAYASTDALIDGAIYYGSIVDGSGCESSVRLEVTVNISTGTTPTTNALIQNFCQSDAPTVSAIQVNEPNVTWYNAPTGGFAYASTDLLVNGNVYYASMIDGFGCESLVRLAVTVTISTGTTPTTASTTQSFCQASNPTVSNIQVNESNVIWYDLPTGGTALPSTALLVNNGVYYASLVDGLGCESTLRLAVTVTIGLGTTPTTTSTTQSFCQAANPTVSNIQVNEPNVIWYALPTGGTPLSGSTLLVNGTTYYASIIDGSGCESSIRLAITVNFIIDPGATITGGSSQSCALEQVTYTTNPGMTNYVWVVTNGTILSGGQQTDNTITIQWSNLGSATVAVSYTNGCSVINSATLNLTVNSCSDLTILKTVDNPTPFIDDNVSFTITVSNVGNYPISNVIVEDVLPTGYSFVSANPSVGTYSSVTGVWTIPLIGANQTATLIIVAKVLPNGNYTNVASIITSDPIDLDPSNNISEVTTIPFCLLVYNEFSPNNDGANDFFNIDCIESYPNNKLEVFNRYGVLVYSKAKYVNDWDGTSNVSGTLNRDDKLPTGTYYYVLDVDNIQKNGWLSITR